MPFTRYAIIGKMDNSENEAQSTTVVSEKPTLSPNQIGDKLRERGLSDTALIYEHLIGEQILGRKPPEEQAYQHLQNLPIKLKELLTKMIEDNTDNIRIRRMTSYPMDRQLSTGKPGKFIEFSVKLPPETETIEGEVKDIVGRVFILATGKTDGARLENEEEHQFGFCYMIDNEENWYRAATTDVKEEQEKTSYGLARDAKGILRSVSPLGKETPKEIINRFQ